MDYIPDPLEMLEDSMEREMDKIDENNTYPCYLCGKRFDVDDMMPISGRPDSPLVCGNCCEHERKVDV